jgi:hypothetical protein
MSKIRCICNIELTVVQPDGVEAQRFFEYGCIYNASLWKVHDDNYITIQLSDGTLIPGVIKNVFENMGVDVIQGEPLEEELEEVILEEKPLDEEIDLIGPEGFAPADLDVESLLDETE